MKGLERAAWLLGGVALGVLLGQWSEIKWESTLELGGILNLITTIVVGVFIADAVRRRSDVGKAEKELLIGHIKEAMELAHAVRRTFAKSFTGSPLSPEDNQDILWNLRHASNTLYLTREISTDALPNAISAMQEPIDALSSYKRIVTGGDRPSFPSGEPMRNQHDNVFRGLIRALTVAIHKINLA